MRKLWFAHTASCAGRFPGGFGTIDEMFEILTLQQTAKLDRKIPMLLYGSDYWREIINFDALVRHGTISRGRPRAVHLRRRSGVRRCVRCRPSWRPPPPSIISGQPAPTKTPAFAPSRIPDDDGQG